MSGPPDTDPVGEQWSRTAFEGAPIGIAVLSPEGDWRRVNRALCDILGQEPDELIGKGWPLADGSDADADRLLRERLVAGELHHYATERRLRHKNGEDVWVEVTASLVRGESGEPAAVVAHVQDVTDRRRYQEVLEEERRRVAEAAGKLSAVLDAATQVAIVATNREGTITIFNTGAERLFGYRDDEVVGVSTPVLFYDAEEIETRRGQLASRRGRPVEAIDVVLETDPAPEPEDWTCVRKDGERLLVNVSTTAMRDPAGEVVAFLQIARDVTERRRQRMRDAVRAAANTALAESASLEDAVPRLLHALATSLGAGFAALWRVDRQTRRLNRTAEWRAPTLSPDEPPPTAWQSPSVAPGAGLVGGVWLSGIASWRQEGGWGGLAAPVALGGDILGLLELRLEETEPPEPETPALLASVGAQLAQYIERDAADRALRSGEERLTALVENMLEGLIIVDAGSVIESVNPAAERLFGYAAWELVGQHLKILLPPLSGVLPDQFLRDATRRAMGRVTEWEGRRKNGTVFPFELSLYEFWTANGRRIAGHIRDVSESRRLERLKKDFVATVSHELRTPLTSIRGSLSLLNGGALGDLPDEAREVVSIAERNTVRLIALINDILDLERLESGRMELHIVDIPVMTVFERALEGVRGMADSRGVPIDVHPTTARVRGDVDRLAQVVINLLSNAVKFSAAGATISVSAAEANGRVEIRVQDQGRGIPASHLAKVFERFEQVQSSDSRQQGGTGLGLAICQAIVEQHGGTIEVESEPGKGSTFRFSIPSAHVSEPSDRFLSTLQSGGFESADDVLVIDDDEALLGILSRQILQQGLGVRTATTVAEGVRAALHRTPALVLLDVALPDGDGFEVVSRLQGEPTLRATPLLVYTVHDLTEDQRRRLRLGPTRFLTKSRASDSDVIEAVRELIAAGGRR